ncbi:MAG: serine/threonine-protein kinase [Planctomycetota bacterium]
MNTRGDPRFFALLVHEGLVSPATAREAMATDDPLQHLLDIGVVTEEQWREWVTTEAGRRPKLSRYELLEELGRGGTARVFRATDLTTDEVVALKVLLPSLCKDTTAVEKFIRESKLLMDLDCEHIVKGYRVAREGDVFFCAMELIEGRCLQDGLDEDHPLGELLALKVVTQVARALSCLHGRDLVHRDIKPGNIMVVGEIDQSDKIDEVDGADEEAARGGERAVLIDLGFAVEAAPAAGEQPAAAETTAGTAHYISPEQARGHQDLDVRADIYSLGATLYHLVTGSLPFGEGTSEEVMARQVLESLSGERIRALRLAPQTHFFIEKMMAKEKEIRFQDPDHLIREIQAYLDQVERERLLEAREAATAARKNKKATKATKAKDSKKKTMPRQRKISQRRGRRRRH